MSSNRPSLGERSGDDSRSGSLPVSLTAVPIAMVVGLGSAWYWHEFAGGFLLLVAIGALVPYAHEAHWSQGRSRSWDVSWTVAASAVATGPFASGYSLAGTLLTDSTHRAAIAFGATFLVGWTLSWLLRRER